MISLVRTLSLALAALAILAATPVAAPLAHAQTSEQEAPAPAEPIAVESSNDGAIEARINAIFDEISALSGVEASVSEGVVSLSGMVANQNNPPRLNGTMAKRSPRERVSNGWILEEPHP